MPFSIVEWETTPNPNALKCVLDRPVSDRPRSFLSASDAAGDPLAERLFAVGGVRNILMNNTWITVNKQPDADWAPLKRHVARVLSEAE